MAMLYLNSGEITEMYVYFIVDQVNVLELGGRNASLDQEKLKVTKWLKKVQLCHRYIFSASANENSNAPADTEQSGTTVIRLLGGMNKEETDHWFRHYSPRLPKLSSENGRLVDYLTGRLPLLLRSLFDVRNFDEQHFLTSHDLHQIRLDVVGFFNVK